ncbi:MAG: RNaseH domain-containing protein [Acidiferrobacter sp.]
MAVNDLETKIVWTRHGAVKPEPLIVGRRINPAWLQNEVQVLQVRFGGPLAQALMDLLAAAKASKKINLPIVRLRASVLAGLEGVISLDRDLGVISRSGFPARCAIELYPPVEGSEQVQRLVQGYLKRWCLDVLEPWAAKHDFSDPAIRVKKAAVLANIELAMGTRHLATLGPGGLHIDFPLAIREIGERLVGEALFFEERGPCELIVNAEWPSNFIELMTPPRRALVGDDIFSMVARLSVVTVPYSPHFYLRVSAAKRVWTKKLPGPKVNAPRRVTAYVVGPPGRPVLPVSVMRTKEGWDFGEDYTAIRLESKSLLPATLGEAVLQQEPGDTGWWAGLPELPTLFDSISPRTVFEADEIDLLNTVTSLLDGIADAPIEFALHKLPRRQGKSTVAMLKLADVGVAGASLVETEEDEESEDEAGESVSGARVIESREQNIRALRLVHGDQKPTLWSFGGTLEEQELIRKSVEVLFGDSVVVKTEVLPGHTHGLRENLPESGACAKIRFDTRVQAWKPAAEAVALQDGPRFALICASDREGRKAEDAVNYYAGMHAMCSIAKANVHHMLPVSGPDPDRAKQSFIHRLQSALLDVFFAHSGIVFGVEDFLVKCFNDSPPKAVYGIQAVRSRARAFSGESDVTFVVVTRLLAQTGITEVQFCFPAGAQNRRSRWYSLNEGLRWLGSQRHLTGRGERWLKDAFKGIAKETLVGIAAEDPRAVVLIDWDNLKGLWPGIRDGDLGANTHPNLDTLDLATAFPTLSLVRVRRSFDSMSLRGMSRTTFDGWREGVTRESTGERLSAEYPTTTKALVEIRLPGISPSAQCGHFISSMGYSKTSQVKRGFSCYRSMPRMSAIKDIVPTGEKARVFERVMLEPANRDAAVPAPLEITVMSTPPDVAPCDIAVTVMGLRLGYAHYSDWTALPAPLFFKRKIEDYIIRYPDAASDAAQEIVGELTTAVDGPDEAGQIGLEAETKLSRAVVASVLPTAPPAPEANSAEVSGVDVGEPEDEKKNFCDWKNADPLSRAKHTDVNVLYSSSNTKRKRLYQLMLQDDARARVRVELPSFVTKAELFGDLPMTPRDCRRFWNWIRELGYIKQTTPQPPADHFQDWLTKRMEKPQAAYALGQVWAARRGFLSPGPVHGIMERYNAQAESPLKLDWNTLDKLVEVSAWASGNQDDYAVAWLIFYAAQLPGFGCAKSVLKGIDELPGPLSCEAVDYFLDCARACAIIAEHENDAAHGFPPVHLKRVQVAAAPTQPPAAPADDPLNSQDTVDAGECPPDTHEVSEDPVMEIKNDILVNLTKLEPGGADFAEVMAVIQQKLLMLEAIHTERAEERAKAERERNVLAQFEAKAAEMLKRLDAYQADFSFESLALRTPLNYVSGQSEPELDKVVSALANFVARHNAAAALASAAPLPNSSFTDRLRRNQEENAAIEVRQEALKALESAIHTCLTFHVDAPSPEPTNGLPDEGTGESPTPGGAAKPVRAPSGTTTPEPVVAQVVSTPPVVMPTIVPIEAVSPSTTPAPSKSSAQPEPAVLPATKPSAQSVLPPGPPFDAQVPAPAQKVPVSVTVTSTGAAEELLVEEEAPNSVLLDEGTRDEAFDTLFKLTDLRRYALATTHLAAMGERLPSTLFGPHQTVLNALFSTLESIDCNFAIDAALNEPLKALLGQHLPEANELCDQLPLSVGVLGAGIIGMLLDNTSTDTRWTVLGYLQARFSDHAGLDALTTRIGAMDTLGIMLTRDQFAASHIGALAAVETELARMRERASNWSNEPSILWTHRAYRTLHEEMFNPQYPIGQCLACIAKGDVARLQKVYADGHKKFDKPLVTLDELMKKTKERARPDGKPRSWLVQNLVATQAFIDTYLGLAEKRANPNQILPTNVQAFLMGLYDDLKRAVTDIDNLKPGRPVEDIYLDAAKTVLSSVLRLFDETRPEACVPYDKQLMLIQLPMGRDFKPSMELAHSVDGAQPSGATPVCGPDEVLAETKRLAKETLALNSTDEDSGIEPALRAAARDHVVSNRFVPAFAIELGYQKIFGQGDASLNSLHQKARNALDSELHDARQQVAHAMALSALETAEANRMLRVIADIRTANNAKYPIGHLECDSVAYPDFPHAMAALRRNVLQALDTKLTDIKGKLAQKIDAYADEFGHDARRDIARIREMLATNNASNLRTAHDAFAMLQKEGRLPPAALSTHSAPELFERFVTELNGFAGSHKPLIESLAEKLTQPPEEDVPGWFQTLDAAARKDAAQFITSWVDLCKTHTPTKTNDILTAFFAAIGLAHPPTCVPETTRMASRVRFYLPDRPFAAESGDFFIPPSLGSRGSPVQGFVFMGRPPDQELRQVIQEAGSTPTFVLARTRLPLEKRAKLSRNAPAIFVDDDLVAYMAVHPADRIRTLLEVALLTYVTHPYADYGGVPVPPEMFFGRQTELDKLRQVKSAAVLYGGRRLGKSSLLDQIEREGQAHPGADAAYIQMDAAKFATDHVLYAWTAVYQALVDHKIIAPFAQRPTEWKAVSSWIEKELSSPASKTRSCYVLLDEADALMRLELDSPPGAPSFIRSLQHLCEAVQKRCHVRYVIAGLHNITRMSTEENSPLGKAETIALEPYSSPDDIQRGIELVTKPLAALGFFFAKGSEDLSLRILSVCNFYPAFIQLYCDTLLRRLYNIRQDHKPPTLITAKDLDAVEHDGNLLTELQRKFELNLNLDKRYKAIALILADVYYAGSDSAQYTGLTVSQIREYCELYAGAHFAKTGPGAYEALVDEMRKLNVLERVGSRYVLRNPNIAMMMGDRERITHQIDELARETPEQGRSHGERRILMRHSKDSVIFPMPAAWVRTNVEVNDGELLILVGNKLSGLPDISNIGGDWTLGQECQYTVKLLNTPQNAASFLRKLPGTASGIGTKWLVAASAHSWKVAQIAEYAGAAMKGLNRGRLALIALPDKAYELSLELDKGLLNPAAGAGHQRWHIVSIPPWTDDAVHFHLDENIAVSENVDACQALLRASCGFGADLARLCSTRLTVEDAKALVLSAEKTLAPDLATFYGNIGMPDAVDQATRSRIETFLQYLDDGTERKSAIIEEAMTMAEVTPGLLQFLTWMGLLQEGPGNTWVVPALYRRLLR